uniref:Uncharacterized protein n=1 Tax=Marseillevirus LCMAC103 TaxID=2506604 RepID=A0A481YU85_9VIRU|nr:MAG: uncharacterized protein LCMAC103_02010 [Marseillevirus LCMAC103]
MTCPANAGRLATDIYGRPVNKNTLDLRDAACSHYTGIPAARFMQFETNHRPHLPICAAGLRGAADFQGHGRDVMPQNLYADVATPFRGNFVRTFGTPNEASPEGMPRHAHRPYHRRVQPWGGSMHATDVRIQL